MYHQNCENNCGDHLYATGTDGNNLTLQIERWYRFGIQVRVNDIGQSNGEAILYLDGTAVATWTDLMLRGDVPESSARIDKIKMQTFYGGSHPTFAPDFVTESYLDNVAVYDMTPICSSGTLHSSADICCAECGGKCGGSGCGNLPGGASKCCTSDIGERGKTCTLGMETACLVPDMSKTCAIGTLHTSGKFCCGLCDGRCGGPGCGDRSGGASQCCVTNIDKSGKTCASTSETGCRIA